MDEKAIRRPTCWPTDHEHVWVTQHCTQMRSVVRGDKSLGFSVTKSEAVVCFYCQEPGPEGVRPIN